MDEPHFEHVHQVIHRHVENQLYYVIHHHIKNQHGCDSVQIPLAHFHIPGIISPEGVTLDQSQVKAMMDWLIHRL